MRDCVNAAMRDRLPDLLNDRLPAAERAEVHAHLNSCADCRAELALLERIRSAAPRPGVDVSRILARVPAYRAAPAWQRAVSSPALRIAAAILLLAAGATSIARNRGAEPTGQLPVAVTPVPEPVVELGDTSRPPAQRRQTPAPRPTELAVGAMFDDLTDAELEALLRSLGALETLTPVETEVVVPAVNRSGT